MKNDKKHEKSATTRRVNNLLIMVFKGFIYRNRPIVGIYPDKQHPHSHDTGFDADTKSSTLLLRPEDAFKFMAVGHSVFFSNQLNTDRFLYGLLLNCLKSNN